MTEADYNHLLDTVEALYPLFDELGFHAGRSIFGIRIVPLDHSPEDGRAVIVGALALAGVEADISGTYPYAVYIPSSFPNECEAHPRRLLKTHDSPTPIPH